MGIISNGTTLLDNGGFVGLASINWDTTAKTSNFTAVSGNGYFVDTTSGAITVTLPASPSAGDVIAFKDYANTFDTNNVTLARNGSNIGGQAYDATLSTEGLAVTLVYVDATKGWIVTDDGLQSQVPTAKFIVASGGSVSTVGDFKIHTFTGPGTFTVSAVGNGQGSETVDYMVVAGGGGGHTSGPGGAGGGGGAGGFRTSSGTASGCYSTSPLGSGVSALPVSAQGYPITVGGGGGGAPQETASASPGSNSSFSTITSTGGGRGAGHPSSGQQNYGAPGGSGGGGGNDGPNAGNGGTGNSPPVSPPQGNPGGSKSAPTTGGGGGGAGSAGGSNTAGSGTPSSITNSNVTYSEGGTGCPSPAAPGPSNSGDGGFGRNGQFSSAGSGGSGIVVIRYKFQ